MKQDMQSALQALKESSTNPMILSMIESQEHMIAESSSNGKLPDFDSIVNDIVAGKRLDGDPDRLVDILKQIILHQHHIQLSLEEEIEELNKEIDATELSEDDAADEIKRFRDSLHGAKFKDLVAVYNRAYLAQFKPDTRVIVVNEIIDYVKSLGREPTKFWSDLVLMNGYFIQGEI